MQIINIGPFPPPYGGVSIHLMRLKHFLDENHCDNIVIDVSSVYTPEKSAIGVKTCSFDKKMILRLFLRKKSILHFHNFSIRLLLSFFLFSFRHTVILSFHNERFIAELKKKGKIAYRIFSSLLNRIPCIIVDSSKCADLAGRLIKNKDKIYLIPEFIPPQSIPPLNRPAIIDLRKNHKFLVSSNAFKISFNKNEDLYGIDLLVEVLHLLHHNHGLDIAIAFLLPSIGDETYFLKLKRQINEYRLENRFLFITEPLEEASSLWKISDMVIRATNTDGNSITVLEALTMGIPIIASDCVERPEGAILFKTRDVLDLERKVLQVIENPGVYKNKIDSVKIDSYAWKILSLYQSLQDGKR